jgi:hypothetical protein
MAPGRAGSILVREMVVLTYTKRQHPVLRLRCQRDAIEGLESPSPDMFDVREGGSVW